MLTAQLDLFNAPAAPAQAQAPAPRPDAIAQLAHRARAELAPGVRHRAPNLQFFGIRGHWLSLCPMPLPAGAWRLAGSSPTLPRYLARCPCLPACLPLPAGCAWMPGR